MKAEKERSELAMASSLLDRVMVTDRVITGDALYCQRQLCEQVVKRGGHYLLIVKSNQRGLYEDIETCFERPVLGETYRYAESEGSHGDRREYRKLCVTDALQGYLEWPGHRQVMKLESWRSIKGKDTRQVRYAITSLGPQASPERLLRLLRGHWGIENGLHYVRDVTLGEDSSQVRTGSAPYMMAALRNLVVGILRLRGATNIAATLRNIGWQPNGALHLLDLPP